LPNIARKMANDLGIMRRCRQEKNSQSVFTATTVSIPC
jgi:hypothetical protein